MKEVTYKELLDAGVHFGHLTRKWNPKMSPYIFMEKNGIHLIDLNKTLASMQIAAAAIKNVVKSGRKVMFVATKKQAQDVVETEAKKLKMPFVTERWLGGMLTNFVTVRKSLKKMQSIEKMMKDEAFENMAKKERLMKTREKEKLRRVLGGIEDVTRLPAALFVIDVKKEHIAVAEAKKLNIPVFAMVDTNSDPDVADYVIPANDDAFKSIQLIITYISAAIEEGLEERKVEREEQKLKEEEDQKIQEDKEEVVASKESASSES